MFIAFSSQYIESLNEIAQDTTKKKKRILGAFECSTYPPVQVLFVIVFYSIELNHLKQSDQIMQKK